MRIVLLSAKDFSLSRENVILRQMNNVALNSALSTEKLFLLFFFYFASQYREINILNCRMLHLSNMLFLFLLMLHYCYYMEEEQEGKKKLKSTHATSLSRATNSLKIYTIMRFHSVFNT